MPRQTQPSIEPATYSVEQWAKRANIGRTLAYELVRLGKVPSIRLGKCIRIPRQAAESLLNGGQAPA